MHEQLWNLVNTYQNKALFQPLIWYSFAGGYGTLEELLEVITWAQLGIHDKPVRNEILHFK